MPLDPKPLRVRAGVYISEGGGPLGFDATSWFEDAGEEDIIDLFDEWRHPDVVQHLYQWCIRKDTGLQKRLMAYRERERKRLRDRWYEILSPWVDMNDAAMWTAVNRTSWSLVPRICREHNVDLLAVMARLG